MQENSVRWFEIYVQDMDRAKRFYETVLQVELSKLENPDSRNTPPVELWAFPMVQGSVGCTGALVKMEGVASGGNSVIVYFGSEDCAVEASRVVAAGGRIHKEKFPIGPYGFIALVFDTEGNLFGLHSMK